MENNMHQQTNINLLVGDATQEERATFYKKTYLHVALSVLAFILVETVLLSIPPVVEFMLSLTQGYLWLALLGAFWLATSMAEKMAHDPNRTKQYLGLGVFILFEALIFVPLLYIAMYYTEGGTDVINQAAIVTLGLFTGLTAVVFLTNKDFSFLRSALSIGVFIAAGLIVAGIIFGFNLGLWFSVGMVFLAGIAILYQTSKLKNDYDTTQYVGAALGLFSSLMLLFWYVLRIFMNRD